MVRQVQPRRASGSRTKIVSSARAARNAANCHALKLQNLIAAPPLENNTAAQMTLDRGLMNPRRGARNIDASGKRGTFCDDEISAPDRPSLPGSLLEPQCGPQRVAHTQPRSRSHRGGRARPDDRVHSVRRRAPAAAQLGNARPAYGHDAAEPGPADRLCGRHALWRIRQSPAAQVEERLYGALLLARERRSAVRSGTPPRCDRSQDAAPLAHVEVQVFGVRKSADTRAALRFFAERRIKVHFVDLNERAASVGELRRFAQKFGLNALVDRESRRFGELGLRSALLSEERWLEKLSLEPLLLRMPLVRNQQQLTIGAAQETWNTWYAAAKS